MNQTAIVDFSQVEDALRNSSRERQVLTAREQTKNTARLIKYGAAGLALVIVSIGIAFWLATQWPHYQAGRKAVTVETAERPILVPAPGSAPTVIQVPENKIMTDVSVFRTIARVDLGLPNSYLHNLTAGHRYPTSNASAWERAWCYADFRKNGLNYKVDIEERTPITRLPIPLSPNERQELGLSDNDIAYLRARCPWR